MDDYTLLSPEKVYLDINLAGIGSRFAAGFIDGIFQVILMLFFVFLVFSLADVQIPDPENLFGNTLTMVLLLIAFVIIYGYYIFFEAIWNGQTPGKRFMKLRVVAQNGSSVTFGKTIMRNIIRIVDSLPIIYAVGMIIVLLNKKNQRLGDMVAGTVVIREIVEQAPEVVLYEVKDTPWSNTLRLHIHRMDERDFAVLKKYLLRRNTIVTGESQAIDQKLNFYYCKKLDMEPSEIGDPFTFLTQIAAHYQNK